MKYMPQTFSKALQNKKLLVAGGVVVIIMLLAFLITQFTNNDEPQTRDDHTAQSYINWLRPSKEIKVGNYRYVSPCSVLPLKQAKTIFGAKFTNKTRIFEDYLDTSLTSEQVGSSYLTTKCTYQFDGTDGGNVSLEVYPFYDEAEITDFTLNVFSSSESHDTIINTFNTVNKNATTNAKDFVATLQKTKKTFVDRSQKIQDHLDDLAKNKTAAEISAIDVQAEIQKVGATNLRSFNGSLAPGASLTTNSGDNAGVIEFIYKYDNAYYSLNYTPAKPDRKMAYDQYGNAFLRRVSDQFGRSFKIIAKNVANTSLSQSPAPTVVGSSDTYGKTKLLEACSIASGDAFISLFGAPQNRPTQRYGYMQGATNMVNSSKAADKIKYDQCDRTIQNTATGKTKAMNFTLYLGPDVKTTNQWQARQAADTDGLVKTELQTNAENAYMLALAEDPTATLIKFQVGPYVGSISPSDADNTSSSPVSQEAAIKAVNVMVAQLKRDMAAAK